MRRFFRRGLLIVLVVVVICAAGLGVYIYRVLDASLPTLTGTTRVAGLTSKVRIERDAAGVPTIHADNLNDRSFAMGYLHAQDRFFQMDLLRRVAAGELCELVGRGAIGVDKQNRLHQFRKRAQGVALAGNPEDREALNQYAAGVNAGLKSLTAKPFEYAVLSIEPKLWSPEDTVLVLFAMYLDLQDVDARKEKARQTAYLTLPKELADFLCPKGCEEWDAPIVGDPLPTPAVPDASAVDLRALGEEKMWTPIPDLSTPEDHDGVEFGSNNWAVSGEHTKHGGAILANDMHLGLRVPNIWYRVSLVIPAAELGAEKDVVATGVSLPGAPSIVVGSNGSIAWGFTNSEGDWCDLVVVEVDPKDPKHYRTADGMKEFELEREVIGVRSEADEILEIKKTIWGPVYSSDVEGRPLAWRWVAHDLEGVNLKSARMVEKRSIEEAMAYAAECGNPAQNFTIADDKGRIGWTIMGRIPNREGFDGWLPENWADGSKGWKGYLAASDYPRVVDPKSGRIWTANARVVSGEMLKKVGFGPYDLGARQKQIRDDLLAIEKADEADMLKVALDDEAIFWRSWQELLMQLLNDESVKDRSLRGEARGYIKDWGGRAAVESVGFRIVRDFQLEVKSRILEWLTHPCRHADPEFKCADLPRSVEGSLGRLVQDRPTNLLDAQYDSWDEFFLASLDKVLKTATENDRPLSEHTWGKYNTLDIRHPLSGTLREYLPDFVEEQLLDLDMPAVAVSGASRNLPKIVRSRSGASERLGVSPGREKDAYFHMPTGQSGHPWSPFYRAGHEDWVQGRFSPFLPGPVEHTLVLEPKS